jgi:ferric-dicitrate binding protein FerR (iron transport regulator)
MLKYMENELSILIEKFLRRQINTGEVSRLKELLTQAEAGDMLSGFYDEKWEQAADTPEKEAEGRIWSKLQGQIQPEAIASFPAAKKRFPWKKGLRIAASILIPLFCTGLGYYYSENNMIRGNNKMTVQVEIGQKAKMQLPDGTHVWLNSASSLAYDNTYNKNERVVYLQGEAYFEVNKDKTCPFIVKSNDISIEALGTSFNVKAYPDDNYMMATLLEGSIRVSSISRSEILSPNERLIFSKNNGQFIRSVQPDAEKNISWINGQLSFEQERLEDIAKVLEHMYNVRVHFTSDKLKNIRFSGTVKNNNLENVLQLIAFVSPIRYSLENDTTITIYDR